MDPKNAPQALLRKLRWWFTYIGPRRDVTLRLENAVLTIDSKDWLIGKHLSVGRQYEATEIQAATALLRRNGYMDNHASGTVVDVGANVGMISIPLLREGYFHRAVAFEPAPNSYRLLVKNVEQNELQDRIITFRYALSSANGEFDLELSPDNSGDNRIRNTNAPGGFKEEARQLATVQLRTLDDVIRENPAIEPEDIKLVWVDIQGHEGQFFQGARGLLSRGIPAVCEFWPYAILRSGLSRATYCQTVTELFSHYYLLSDTIRRRHPISTIDNLFEEYKELRQMCVLLFFP